MSAILERCFQMPAEELSRFMRTAPVCPFEVADALDIRVEKMPSSASSIGVSGMLLKVGDCFTILYSTQFRNHGFERFSVAHELGHYLLPDHPERAFSCSPVHESHAAASDEQVEKEADAFAAGLLMPDHLFGSSARGQSIEEVVRLSEVFQTSLLATAFQLVSRSDDHCAVVVSNRCRVEKVLVSPELRALGNLRWPSKGDLTPLNSSVKAANQSFQTVATSMSMQDWFDGPVRGECYEQSRRLGNYGRVLTVITFEVEDPEDIEEEESLREQWTPSFH